MGYQHCGGCCVQNPVLAFFVAAAGAAKESALLIYVQQQLEYAKLWKLFEFSQVGCFTCCESQLLLSHSMFVPI